MANPEHLKILKQGEGAWRGWRMETSKVKPDLSGALLAQEHFYRADLHDADLSRALLVSTNLIESNLSGANLHRADLTNTNLSGACLRDADLSEVHLMHSIFAFLDLRNVKGLESVRHYGPSSIGIETIYQSDREIPEVFLRGAGVPEEFIIYAKSLVGKALDFYSCFISYSTKDQEFADRLHADLQNKGVRCWFASRHSGRKKDSRAD